MVKKTEPKFSANGRSKFVNIPGAKHFEPVPSSSVGKFSLQWMILESWQSWSHPGQKNRTEIFCQWAAKIREYPWREIFLTSTFMFRRKMLPPVEDFGNLTHLISLGQKDRTEIFGQGSAKIRKYPWKETFGTSPFMFRSEIQISAEIFALEREFRSGTWRQWSRKYHLWKFHPFWPPCGRKLRIGLFDRRASKWWFWRSCDQNPCLVVLTSCDYYPILVLSTNSATNGGLIEDFLEPWFKGKSVVQS